MNVNQAERKEWTNLPATKELVMLLKVAKQDSMEKWAAQGYETERNNDFALGGIATINEVLEYIEECGNVSLPE